MSVTRSPRLNEIRRREDEADSRRTKLIIAILCGAAVIANLIWVASMVAKP